MSNERGSYPDVRTTRTPDSAVPVDDIKQRGAGAPGVDWCVGGDQRNGRPSGSTALHFAVCSSGTWTSGSRPTYGGREKMRNLAHKRLLPAFLAWDTTVALVYVAVTYMFLA